MSCFYFFLKPKRNFSQNRKFLYSKRLDVLFPLMQKKKRQLCVDCLKGKEECIITTSVSISKMTSLFLRHCVKATLLKLEHEPHIYSYSSKSIVWRQHQKEIQLKSSRIIPDYVKKLWLAYCLMQHTSGKSGQASDCDGCLQRRGIL